MSIRSEVVRIFNELLALSKKISALPSAGAITGSELIEVVQNGANVKTTISAVASGGAGVLSIVEGTNITIDDTDPQNPIISSTGGGGASDWGDLGGTLSDQTDLQDALDAKAPLLSPTLTGTPAAPTAAAATNTTQIATTAFVRTEIASLVDSSPGTLDTLNELAAALGDDPNFATTTATAIGLKVAKAGDTMGGNLAMGSNKVTGLAAASGNGEAVRYEQITNLLDTTSDEFELNQISTFQYLIR